MSVLSELKKAGGCSGGVAVYSGAKALALAANVQRKRRKLWASTKKLMKNYFPKLDLGKVRFCIHSSLPGNWFTSRDSVQGMTFGYTIFFKGTNLQKSRAGLKLLMHELVHVDQVRRKGGEIAFACAYGKGYLSGGSYRQNPMEVEAYDFVAKHGSSLPDGVTKPEIAIHSHGLPRCQGGKHHKSCAGKKAELFCIKLAFGSSFTCAHTK